MMRVWIDIENPPQVQYLLPFRRVFEEHGDDVVVTARDYGNTFELLEHAHADYRPVGASYGRGKLRKAAGLARRSRALRRLARREVRPDLLLSAGRASAVVARTLRIPSFVVVDYEFVHLRLYGLTRSWVLFPDSIDPEVLAQRGVRRDRLLPFAGLKEDVSFAGVDLDAAPAHTFPEIVSPDLVRVLFRPAAEESHYYRPESGRMALDVLAHLARRPDVVLVFAPRYPSQAAHLDRFSWATPPVLLREAVPFVPLLKAVDAVVSAGGTMLREAAYLGVPAYSLFQGPVGGVDRRLQSLGRLHFVASRRDVAAMELHRLDRREPLRSNPSLLAELTERIRGQAVGRGPSP